MAAPAPIPAVVTLDSAPCTTDCLYAWVSNFHRQLGTADGTVWSWGFSGAVGTGQPCWSTGCDLDVPARILGLTDVTSVESDRYNGYALRTDGTVWSWGDNLSGQLGTGTDCNPLCSSDTPLQVVNLTDATQLGDFDAGAYALRADGTVLAWGSNVALGNDLEPGSTATPVQVTGLTGVSGIGSGTYTGFALVPQP